MLVGNICYGSCAHGIGKGGMERYGKKKIFKGKEKRLLTNVKARFCRSLRMASAQTSFKHMLRRLSFMTETSNAGRPLSNCVCHSVLVRSRYSANARGPSGSEMR